MRVTIKSDIIKVGYNLPRIFTCSIYYTKHVYLLRTITKNITCTTTKKGKYGISQSRAF